MGTRLIRERMFGEQCRQPNGLITKILAHQPLPARRLVPFVEKEVESLQHAVEADRELLAGRNFEGNTELADFLARPREPLGNGCFRRQKCFGDLGSADSAKRLQRKGALRLVRNERMTAGED